MGKSGFVPGQDERVLDDKYKIQGRKGVQKVLVNIHQIYEMRHSSNALCDLLLDLNRAIQEGGLNDNEKRAIYHRFELIKNFKEVAQSMNLSPVQAKRLIRSSCVKIANVFKKWDY